MRDRTFPQQVQDLAPFLAHYNPQKLYVQDSIRTLLTIFRNRQACNFLLNTDAATTLSILTNPQFLHNAAACCIQQANIGPPVHALHQTIIVVGSYVFVPVYQVMNYNVGFIVGQQTIRSYKDLGCTEVRESARAEWNGEPHPTHVLRFAQDRESGSVFILVVAGEEIFIDFHVVKSSTLVKIANLNFNRHEFLRRLHQFQDTTTEHDLINTVSFHYASDFYRDCILCLAPPSLSCRCSSENASLTDGNTERSDFSDLFSLISLFSGEYQGIGQYDFFAKGAFLECKAYGQIRKVEPIFEWNLIKAVMRTGMTRYLSELGSNPWSLALPEPQQNPAVPKIEDKRASVSITACANEDPEKQLKKKLRVERNRAFARRSNLRKKMENDYRKQELQRLRSLESQLVAKERKLRQENMAMRKLLQSTPDN